MKTIGIEALVKWAVLEEWPKARDVSWSGRSGPSGWSRTGRYLDLLCSIDLNRYGVIPDLSSAGDPYPDAVAVAEAVARLEGASLPEIDPDWLIGDLVVEIAGRDGDEAGRAARRFGLGLVARALDAVTLRSSDGARLWRERLDEWVIRSTIVGRDDWRAPGPMTWGKLLRANGSPVWRRTVRAASAWNNDGEVIAWREVEVEAPLVNGRRPADAYPVMCLMPDASALIAARIRHAVWSAAMATLAELLAGRLGAHEIGDGGPTMAPWIFGGSVRGRILTDVGAGMRSDSAPRKNRLKGLT